MANKGWANVSLKDGLVAQIDAFLLSNDSGYSNRAEVVTAAVRQFLEGQKDPPLTAGELSEALRAVASTEPSTVDELLKALLAELD